MDSTHHQHGEVLLSLLARHKSLEGRKRKKFSNGRGIKVDITHI